MKSEFTDDQLYLIRDAFCEMCCRSIDSGKLQDAQEDLGIINTVQSYFGEYEYNDLDHFKLHNYGLWTEVKERVRSDAEIKAVHALVCWAKSDECNLTSQLQLDVDNYLDTLHINDSSLPEHTTSHRLIAIERLIVYCIRQCTRQELNKMITIKQKLAQKL